MVFAWNIHFTIWLVILAGVSCEISDNCMHGSMKASATARQVLPGSDVTLSCWLKNGSSCGSRRKIVILHNNSEVHSSYGRSASAPTLLSTFGKQKFECGCSRRPKNAIICGLYIYVGIPPDQPKNTVCIQYGKDGATHCTWEKGRYTYLATNYTLQLQTNGNATNTSVEINDTHGSANLRERLNDGPTYTVVVFASNDLGTTSSQPIQFTQIDIVKPHPPGNISVKCDYFDATNCTISWQVQQEMGNFRLRYQPIGSNSWTMLDNITARRYVLWDLKQNSDYEFQVSGKFLPNRGLWSDWSMSYQIEAVPFGPIDTWYIKKDVSPLLQNITLFWKTVILSGTGRKSHNFTVTFQSLTQKHQRAAETISTTETIFSKVTTKRDFKLILRSYNSRGASPQTILTTELETSEDLPPPYNLSAVSIGNGTIFVDWKEPLTHSQLISGYVVGWAKFHQGSHLETYSDWLKIPESKLKVKIENLEPHVCYHIGVFALNRDRAGKAARITGDTSAKAPLSGPQINLTVNEGRILVSWREIPEDLQRGCIISYKIYLQKQFHTIVPKMYDIPKDAPQPFPVKNLQPGDAYGLWMTAATKAGESPRGNEEMIYIKNTHDFGSVLAICIILGLLACVCFVPSVRRMVFSILSVFLSGWYNKAIPDPANSSWAKEFISVKDESSLYSAPFLNHLHCFEEPETLPIEEILTKKFPVYKGVLLFRSTEKGEGHSRPTGSNSQEESPTVKGSDCDPLITSTLYVSSDTPQLPSLYRKVAPEEPTQGQMLSEYLANPLENETDYLPLTISPTVMNPNEDSGEIEFSSFFDFPRTSFVPQTCSFGGKLTLNAIRMDCNSFTD